MRSAHDVSHTNICHEINFTNAVVNPDEGSVTQKLTVEQDYIVLQHLFKDPLVLQYILAYTTVIKCCVYVILGEMHISEQYSWMTSGSVE